MVHSARSPRPLRLPRRLIGLLLPLGVVLTAPLGADARQRLLTDAEWRADLDRTVAAIDEIHPDPYTRIERAELDSAAAELRQAIPTLSDREILVRLAVLVARLEDGHTRLFLPRQHAELAPVLETGHSGTAPPRYPELALAQLPVRFGLFTDGLFVTAAVAEHADLVGLRVLGVGTRTVEEALAAAGTTIAGNDSRRRALLPDRMALPDLLAALGITESPEETPLRVATDEGAERRVTLRPLPRGEVEWIGGPESPPLWRSHPTREAWFELLPSRSAVFVQVDELEAKPDLPWADFVRRTLAAARAAGAERYVLDLRQNTGGSGMWVVPFIGGLAGSEFDHYGRLMVLIGGNTFSAAQMLVNRLERYTEACFVGEATGAPPTHYGDSKKVLLAASGLTLRVSSRYWPNSADDFRHATEPHIDAAPRAADFFAGRDPALEVALSYEPPVAIAAQVEDLLRRGKVQSAVLRFVRDLSDPRVEHRSTEKMAAAGHRLLDEGLVEEGRIVFLLAAEYYPPAAATQAGLGRALELAGDAEAARQRYREALRLDPAQRRAAEGLARLEGD